MTRKTTITTTFYPKAHNCYYVYFDNIAYYIDANTITNANKADINAELKLQCATDTLKLTECPNIISSYMADECEMSGTYSDNKYYAAAKYGCATEIAKQYGWYIGSAPNIFCPQKK